MVNLREKSPVHPQEELGLSHMWPELGLNTQRRDEERFRALNIRVLNNSATEAARKQDVWMDNVKDLWQ